LLVSKAVSGSIVGCLANRSRLRPTMATVASEKRMSFSFSFDGQVGGQVYSVTDVVGQYSLSEHVGGRHARGINVCLVIVREARACTADV